MILLINERKKEILQEVQELYEKGDDLSATGIEETHTELYRRAKHLFGSWKAAINALGLEYSEHKRTLDWTPETFNEQIWNRFHSGQSIQRSDVFKEDKLLVYAGERFYESWTNALIQAGILPPDYERHRTLTATELISKIITLDRQNEDLSITNIKQNYEYLIYPAYKHFGGWKESLYHAGVDYYLHRRIKEWTRDDVLSELLEIQLSGVKMTSTNIKNADEALYRASLRLFGSWRNTTLALGEFSGITV